MKSLIVCVTALLLMLAARSAQSDSKPGDPGFDKRYGIGAVVVESEAGIVVAQVLANGPASRAGLQAGDRLVTVDDVPVKGRSVPDVVDMLTSTDPGVVSIQVNRSAVSLLVNVLRATYSEIAVGAGLEIQADSLGARFVPITELATLSVGGKVSGLWLGNEDCEETYLSFASGAQTFVYVWASWCGPCKVLMRNIAELSPGAIDQDIRVVGINVDKSCDLAMSAMEALNPPGRQYWGYGLRGYVSQQLRSYDGIPCGAVLGGDGSVEGVGRGADELLKMFDAMTDVDR